MTIPVAHDFICPWCWIGLFQVKRLKKEFGVEIEWLSYELYPDELEWPERSPAPPSQQPERPKTPSRLDLAFAAEELEKPMSVRPSRMRDHNAHEAVEFVKDRAASKADEFVEAIYRAYWEDGLAISDPAVLEKIAVGLSIEAGEMIEAVKDRRYREKIVGFDNSAYATGVFNVPTFFISGERYAEESYMTLRAAMKRAAQATGR